MKTETSRSPLDTDQASIATRDSANDKMATNLKNAFMELRKLDATLIEQRKPVNVTTAAIKGVYDTLEKQGIDRKLVKFLYKQKRSNTFTVENLISLNAYSKALEEEQLPLFVVEETTKH